MQMLLDDYAVKVNKRGEDRKLPDYAAAENVDFRSWSRYVVLDVVYAQRSSSRYSTEANPHEDLDRIIFPAFKRPGDSIKLRHP